MSERSRAIRVAAAVAVGFVAVGTAGLGLAGLVATLSVLAVAAATVAVIGVPGAPSPHHAPRPGPPVENAPFRSYRAVSEALSWADVSPRHYDLVTKPMLVGLLESRLSDRHRIDLAADPEAARRLVGDDVWHWLDPNREVDNRGQPPGVDLATLARIVERLERL